MHPAYWNSSTACVTYMLHSRRTKHFRNRSCTPNTVILACLLWVCVSQPACTINVPHYSSSTINVLQLNKNSTKVLGNRSSTPNKWRGNFDFKIQPDDEQAQKKKKKTKNNRTTDSNTERTDRQTDATTDAHRPTHGRHCQPQTQSSKCLCHGGFFFGHFGVCLLCLCVALD